MWSNAERVPAVPIVLAAAGVVLLIVAFMTAMRSTADELVGGPYYFVTAEIVSGAPVPIMPMDEVAEAGARERTTYGIAMYDQRGRLASYEMVKDGKRVWLSRLSYSSAGPLESEVYEGPSGAIVLWKYDRMGRFVDSTMIKASEAASIRAAQTQ